MLFYVLFCFFVTLHKPSGRPPRGHRICQPIWPLNPGQTFTSFCFETFSFFSPSACRPCRDDEPCRCVPAFWRRLSPLPLSRARRRTPAATSRPRLTPTARPPSTTTTSSASSCTPSPFFRVFCTFFPRSFPPSFHMKSISFMPNLFPFRSALLY